MHIIEDLRQAWRGLLYSPGFLFLSSGVLALGLATTIFMYGVFYTMLEKPPPYPQAEQLVLIRNSEPARDISQENIETADYDEYVAAQSTLQSMVATYSGTMTLSGRGLPERVSGTFTTVGLFATLRVAPTLGRDFMPADHELGASPVVIISHDLWKTRFVSDPAVLGKSLKVNGELTTIVGVMPQGFQFPTNQEQAWKPLQRDPAKERRGDPNANDVEILGRLRDDVSMEQAQAQFAAIAKRLEKRYPQFDAGKVPVVDYFTRAYTGPQGVQIVTLLFYVVWGVLGIACANVASLIFVRANHRAYESSMRAALGASRARLVSLTLAESAIVAGLAVMIGLAVAAVGFDAIQRAMIAMFNGVPIWWTFGIDWHVALFAAGTALLAGCLAGVWPAWRASQPDIMRILRDGGRTGTGMRLSKFNSAMVVIEVALAIVLLSGAGVATRTVLTTLIRDYGVSAEGIMTGRVMLLESNYDIAARANFFLRAASELQVQPGVLAATATTIMPGTGAFHSNVAIDGRSYADRSNFPQVQPVAIIPGFFSALGTNIKSGRDFSSSDRTDTLKVAIVNQAFAEQQFGDDEPIGKRIKLNPEDKESAWLTIIGIAPNINHDDAWDKFDAFPAVVYKSLAQLPERFVTLAVKVKGDPHRYAGVLRQTISRLDSDLPVYFLGTLMERQDVPRAGMKMITILFVIFAAIAIALAAVGLYGVLAFATNRRTREIGIRRSLGARDGQVLTSVLRGAAIQVGIGLALGALLAPLLVTALPTFITNGSPHQIWVYAVVLALVATIAVLASWIPARRALRVQPAVALRYE